MNILILFVGSSIVSFVVMVVVDYFLGPRAEFINAYSALERLFGQNASAGKSHVALEYGVSGELLGVLIVSLLGGFVLTVLVKVLWRA